MARYHVCATEKLLAAVGNVETARAPAACLFFDTIHATVNHIAGVEVLWRLRLTGHSSAGFDEYYVNDPASSGVRDGQLWQQRQPDWTLAAAEALAEAQRTLDWVGSLSDEQLLETCRYHRTDGTAASIQRGPAVMHLLNHATHHRGQIHAALTQFGHRSLELDIPATVGLENCVFK
jgi:uncharacterized damage-inducible protein DinB